MEADEGATLLPPPPKDPSKASIENVVEVTAMGFLGPDVFTNTRRPWQPPGARGIYGGTAIAQSLASAQRTVPDDLVMHSCHCYFLLAGSAEMAIVYHVERVRDGRSFATRTVQARQRGRCLFTATVSFVRGGSGGAQQVRHAVPLPAGVKAPDDGWDGELALARRRPFQSHEVEVVKARSAATRPDERKCRQWVRARGRISGAGGQHQAHLTALAYMSDSFFIGTVPRVHRLWRYPVEPGQVAELPASARAFVERANELEGMGATAAEWAKRPRLGMLVSLNHSIYFHAPLRVRADEWIFTEMESPWSGDGPGLVTQRIFARDGTLLATCIQEGVVRLKQDGTEPHGGAKL